MRHKKIKIIIRKLMSFAIPMAISGFVIALSTLINTKFIGVRKTDLYLFSIFAPIFYFMLAFQESFRAAAIMIAANRQQIANIKTTLAKLLLIVASVGLFFSIILICFGHEVGVFLQVNKLFLESFQQFLKQIIPINLILISLTVVLNAFIFGLGLKKAGLLFSILSSGTTSLLLYIQITYLKMDIHALGVALEISGLIIFPLMLCFLRKQKIFINPSQKKDHSDFKLIWSVIQKISCPLFLSYITLFGGLIAFNSILSAYSLDVVSGYYVGYRLQTFIILPAISIGSAMAILIKNEEIDQSAQNKWLIIVVGFVFSIFFYGLISQMVYHFRNDFISLIISEMKVQESAEIYLKYAAQTYVVLGPLLAFLTMLEQIGYGFSVLLFNLFYFLIIFLVGKHLVITHHSYTSFYQLIRFANYIAGFLIISAILILGSIDHGFKGFKKC